MPEQYRALQGFRDILPDEQTYWRYVENTATEVAELYGYRRIETPLLEETSVYRRTSGEGTDIVDKEMYSFDDRPDKENRRLNLTLRPEGTAGVVRAYIEHGMFKLSQPVKLYYMRDPMFRRDRPQAGRYREHHQFGIEALGEDDPAIDAEVIGLLYQIYTRLGLKDVHVYINSIGDQNCRPQYIEVLKEYYHPLLADCCADCQVRFHKNPLRLLDCKEPQDQPKIAAAPKMIEYLCELCHEHFEEMKRYLEAYQVPFRLDPLIVRGLDYYSRTVFEFTPGADNRTALNGGGRYDGLAEILGGQHTPAIGFGAGIERIILELKRNGITPPPEPPPFAFVVYFDKTADLKNAAVEITAQLRYAGIKSEMSYHNKSRKAQMRRANDSGASYAILLKEEELAQGFVTVKNMLAESSEIEDTQVQVKRSELLAYLKQVSL